MQGNQIVMVLGPAGAADLSLTEAVFHRYITHRLKSCTVQRNLCQLLAVMSMTFTLDVSWETDGSFM